MYYLITEQIVQLAEGAGEDREKACEALEYLDLASRLGKHFVCAEESKLFDRILDLPLHTQSFREIRNNFSFVANIGKTYHWHAEFLPSKSLSSIDSTNKIVYISLSDLSRFEVYRETQVLGENLSDVSFFKVVLNYYKRSIGVERTNNCFHPLLGGGHTTSEVYKYESDNPCSFLLCITDSDYKYSGAPLGDTAKAIKQISSESGSNRFNALFYHIKGAREIENLIPLSIYIKYASNPQTGLLSKVNNIRDLFKLAPSLAPFFDMKEGISLHTLINRDPADTILEEVKKVAPDIESKMAQDYSIIEEQCPGINGNAKKEELKKIHYFYGLGGRILENIVSSIGTGEIEDEMEQQASLFQKEEYDRIGQLMYDWTASSFKKRL